MRKMIYRGELGPLRCVDVGWVTSVRADPDRLWNRHHSAAVGGGVINAFFSHTFDFTRWIAKSQLVVVSGLSRILISQRKVRTLNHFSWPMIKLSLALLELN